ncbi:MAG: polysaccharide deacetylase family protein [Elusimicrobiota bacterium]
MTRFHYATTVTAVGIIGSAALLGGPARWWCAGSLFSAYLIISGAGVFAIGLNYYCESVCRGKPGNKRIALTFDDGPDPEATPTLLKVLETYKARATFFCTGERAEANGDIIRRIVKEGHTLGNHSYAHKWWNNFLPGRPLKAEILHARQVLRELSGISPRYYRSPMGLTNPHLGPVLRATGLKLIGWDVRPYDRGTPAKVIISRIAGAARDGSIVLLHDGGASPENLAAAVTGVIERFQSLGYTFVNLDELFQE